MQRPVLVVATVLAAVLACCAVAHAAGDDPRIVGGTDAKRPWPAQGALLVGGARTFVCGGTLVSGRWFLTAAHCVTDPADGRVRPASAFTVSLGSTNRTLGTAFGVSSTDGAIRHELYSPRTQANDVALLELTPAPQPSESIQPLGLVGANESALWAPGTIATIIGWGATCSTCPTTTRLQEAGVPIVSDATCSSAYGNGFVAPSMLCAGNGVTDTCQGDSGGPIMVPRGDAYVLMGVTSKGIGCADPNYPGVYARLGAAGLNGWMRDRIPTVRIDSPALTRRPAVNEDVALSATGVRGLHSPPEPGFQWSVDDLDGGCSLVAVSGASATLRPNRSGSCAITVQQVYPDGDRAVAREVVTTSSGPDPPASDAGSPVPPAAMPVAPASPEAPPAPIVPRPPPASARKPKPRLVTLSAPKRIRVSALLDGRFAVTVRCFTGCRLRAAMKLDARTSRVLGMTRKIGHSVRVGSGSARRSKAGRFRLTLHVPRSARIGLRSARSGKLTLLLTARHSKRTENHKRIIRLSR